MSIYRHLLLAAALGASLTAAWADGKAMVSIEARDRDLREVVQVLATAAGVTVKLQPDVHGRITTNIRNTPFERALTVVTETLGYAWKLVDGVYYVGQFGPQPDDGKPVTRTVPIGSEALALSLARGFGWLDLATLDEAGGQVDLTSLLPPGLQGPPRPVKGGLEVRGSASATADFAALVARLVGQGGCRLTWDCHLAVVPPTVVENLRVYWAQGPMRVGASPGRVVVSSTGDFSGLWARLTAMGVKASATPKLVTADHLPGRLTLGPAAAPVVDLRLAGRVEAALGLSLWLKLRYADAPFKEQPVVLTVDGAPLPPEEDLLVVSKPPTGQSGPSLLLLLEPTVAVPGEATPKPPAPQG